MTQHAYGVRSSVGTLERVAVRRPLVGGPDVVAQYEQAHWQTPDLDRLAAQHAGFVQTLRDLGSDVVELDPVPGLPDAVFVYDPAFVIPSGTVVFQAAKQARVGEGERLGADLELAGVPIVGRLVGDATADAGDMFWLDGDTVAIGRGYRTNQAAIDQMRGILAADGVAVEQYDLPHDMGPEYCLHLMSVISPVREDLAVVYERLAPVAMLQALTARGIQWVTVDDEEYATLGCNVLAVRPGVVVMGQRNVRTADKLREAGVEVHTFDSEQSDKGEGGPTCMTRPILRT
ncbi:MAG TPA: arginine deiminase family protein [Candidatus Nanopelagicales bacterium]|nr:arginine deiminase family protein [Candidatus Nanopelagicales bacterium]